MHERRPSTLLHRFALFTACVALLPIVVGAIVTTMKWGMAFLDWPTSDGHNMFLYPWLASFAQGDKFTEHAHRLAGALIGVTSIGLVAITFWKEKRGWVKGLAAAILAAVIVQGLLGGLRVVQDADTAAMVHGSLAAIVFTMMGAFVLVTGGGWLDPDRFDPGRSLRILKPLALVTPAVVFGQYVLGGMLRHLGTALYEHMGVAVVAALLVIATAIVAFRTGAASLRRPAGALLAILLIQLSLGLGSYVTKFGLASTGYVAVEQSLPQVVLRTSHTVVGILLLMTSVVFAVRVLRWEAVGRRKKVLEQEDAWAWHANVVRDTATGGAG